MATALGLPGAGDRLDDLSPGGLAAVNQLAVQTVEALAAAPSTRRLDDVARQFLLERLRLQLDRYQSGWAHADLNVIASPVQMVLMIFDLMPTGTAQELVTFAARMRCRKP